jgi:nematocidal protein AidA
MPAVNAPHNPRTIYIQTIFDTETILKKYAKSTNPSSPTFLPTPGLADKPTMFMLTNWDDHLSGQATGNLEIQAEVNDNIYWRTMSLSNNTGDAVLFYDFVVPSGAVIAKPRLKLSQVTVPIPTLPFEPPAYAYKMEAVTDVHWMTEVDHPGSSLYQIRFFILTQDPGTRSLVRYFYTWDPKITVKQT